MKLRVVPAKRLHFKSHRERLSDCLTNLEHYNQENSHFEFFWFPYTPWVQAKFLNETEVPVSKSSLWGNFNKIVLENGLYWLLSECCRLLPPLSRTISTISAMSIAPVNEVNSSHRLYVAPRMVRLQGMEYAIPVEHVQTVLSEIQACINQYRFQVHFPLGVVLSMPMTSGSVRPISASRPISLCICTEGWSTNPISSMLRRFCSAITDAHTGERCIPRMPQGWQLSIRTGTISDAYELPLILKVYSLTITCTDYLMPTGLCRLIQPILMW